MDPLAEIAKYIAANKLGTVGKDIFVNEMPVQCRNGILVFTSGEGLIRHTDIPNYYRGVVFIAARGTDTAYGAKLSSKLVEIMEMQGKTVGCCKFIISKPIRFPEAFPRNDGGYVEWLLPVEIYITLVKEEK